MEFLSLKRPKIALLKCVAVVLLTVLLPPHLILSSTSSQSLQPRLLPAFTYPTRPSLFVSIRLSSTPFLVISLTTYVRKLSSMFSRNFLDALSLTVLLLQQVSEWLISPTRTRASGCRVISSCLWKALLTSSS